MEPFEIVMGSENDAEVNELSSRSSSADDMTRFLKSLSPEQIAELAQDREGLRALYNELLAIQARPGRNYLARTRSGSLIGCVTVKEADQQIPELQVEILPPYRRQ